MSDDQLTDELTKEEVEQAIERLIRESGIYSFDPETPVGKEVDRMFVEWFESRSRNVRDTQAQQGAEIAVMSVLVRRGIEMQMMRLLPLPTDASKKSAAMRATYRTLNQVRSSLVRDLSGSACHLLGLTSTLQKQAPEEPKSLRDELRERNRQIEADKQADKQSNGDGKALSVGFSEGT